MLASGPVLRHIPPVLPDLLHVRASELLFGTLLCAAFCVLLFVGAKILPGRVVLGQPLRDGSRRPYKMNGMSLFVALHMGVFVAFHFWGLSPSILIHNFRAIFWGANVVTLVWLVWMLQRAPQESGSGDDGLHSGPLARIWYGYELNPEYLGVDLKTFAYQPSLLGLTLLNWSFAFAQFEATGTISRAMFLYQAFWWTYMFTHFWFEDAVLSMWDVIAEKFGFMLLWGDLVLVPFFYCVPGFWVLSRSTDISLGAGVMLAALFATGLWIFRGSNAQKNQFKRDPTLPIWGKAPQVLGGRLLISGWWGVGRKINYTGEIMVYSSYALCTGLSSWVPFLLPLWLLSLLIHRAWRDEQRCRAKYGALWDEYCKIARFRMVPFIY